MCESWLAPCKLWLWHRRQETAWSGEKVREWRTENIDSLWFIRNENYVPTTVSTAEKKWFQNSDNYDEKWVHYDNPKSLRSINTTTTTLLLTASSISTAKRACWVFSKIMCVWCTISCSDTVKQSMCHCIELNCCVWAKHWRQNDRNTSEGTAR